MLYKTDGSVTYVELDGQWVPVQDNSKHVRLQGIAYDGEHLYYETTEYEPVARIEHEFPKEQRGVTVIELTEDDIIDSWEECFEGEDTKVEPYKTMHEEVYGVR